MNILYQIALEYLDIKVQYNTLNRTIYLIMVKYGLNLRSKVVKTGIIRFRMM